MKKIGIDYRFAAKEARGIGNHVKELVAELQQIDSRNTYLLYVDAPVHGDLPPNFSYRLVPQKNLVLFEQFALPRAAREDRLDVLWCPANSGPLRLHRSICLLVTVHDLISFMQFNAVQEVSVRAVRQRLAEYYRRWALKYGLGRINRLLTVSRFSADEIYRRLGRRAEVVANHIRLDDSVADEPVSPTFGLVRRQYLYTMTGELPHKNFSGLLPLVPELPAGMKLVVSGVSAPFAANRIPAEYRDRVVITGFVSAGEKKALYRDAAGFVFIPFYEGFGIPLLEAMAQGLPILASDRAAIPDVLGGGGVLVDPEDSGALQREFTRLAGIDRADYRAAQQEQLRIYSSWERSARVLLSVIDACR